MGFEHTNFDLNYIQDYYTYANKIWHGSKYTIGLLVKKNLRTHHARAHPERHFNEKVRFFQKNALFLK